MKEDIVKTIAEQTKAARVVVSHADRYAAYVGLDVHKDTIAVAVALPGRDEPLYRGEIANEPRKVGKWLDRLSAEFDGVMLQFCYEAGPCGYGLYRRLLAAGHDCQVVAPSLIPKKAGERIKTDRRDALKLARLLRAGELTAVWVPDAEQEAMRDLTRAREDMKGQERKARQQLNAFVLRHGHHWPSGKKRWAQPHFNWLESIKQVSLRSRERFWDIQVPKIDSIFDNSLVPRTSWSPGVPPQHRKLVAAAHRSPI